MIYELYALKLGIITYNDTQYLEVQKYSLIPMTMLPKIINKARKLRYNRDNIFGYDSYVILYAYNFLW